MQNNKWGKEDFVLGFFIEIIEVITAFEDHFSLFYSWHHQHEFERCF
jgi:hypothetical protein